ncbi:MAG TPA: DUF1834 family protein [Syntrophorhabdaceae bacterium]|nr:DUF1834 family protein [Syntrophorhabdaceae bacterium]
MHTIEEIEDRILAELRASALSTTVKNISTYHGEMDSLVEELRRLTIMLPAVFVLYGGSQFSETANRSYDDEPVFTIVAIAKDLRGRDKRRTGMYAILEALKDTLIDNDLGFKDTGPLKPISIEAILITQEFSVYALDLRTTFSRD